MSAPIAGVAGIAAVAVGAGLGELVGALVAPESRPFAVVGGALIDAAPSWAKDTAIALFGTADKIALLVGIGIVAIGLAFFAGWLQARRPPWGVVLVAAVGVAGAVVATTRADAGSLAWVPAAVAGGIGAVTLWGLIRMLRPREPVAADGPEPSRRAFFAVTGVAVGVGVLATIAASARRAGGAAVEAVRSALRLPAPAVAASPVPTGAELDIPGLARVVTPNDQFYRIDTAIIVPEVDPADWSLRIHGMVEREVVLTWDELLALPLDESWTTLACVSNEVGGTLIGNAKWLGYPIRSLLERAQPTADADMVLSRSIDGFTASTPLDVLTDDRDAILAVGMNEEPLPLEHGFPVRMVVPGLYGYVSATKWVTELEVTRFDRARGYWTDRGWSERGPIKLQSRIDVPRKQQGLKAGDTVIAGVAWQQHVGVTGVEVQIDEGEWMPARLATAISDDTWVQWSMPWTATVGDHLLRCRAISADGEVQTSDRAHPAPDGATGWHERFITVFE
ncbi:molybdopterin-dependent oxidoreductase [Microbacterium aoyamense]|uniref:Molybdopterin-dependent oxidoreductase n=1 Tax=Microbacterium aoyamense TaxID=344166 RepID=A0ABN2PMD9_9MICO